MPTDLIKLISLLTLVVLVFTCCSDEQTVLYTESLDRTPVTAVSQPSSSARSTPIVGSLSTPIFTPTLVPTVTTRPVMSQTPHGNEPTPFVSSPFTSVEKPPKLQNLLIGDLGPYNPAQSTFGDLKYDGRFRDLVFNDFGALRIDGRGNEHYNVAFEFRAPSDTLLVAPMSGVISYIEWQPRAGDWEIHISSKIDSKWKFGIDHILSRDCSLTGARIAVCELPLTIDGRIVTEGTQVSAGTVIGYIGTWSDPSNIGINGRTELTVFKYLDGYSGTMNYCPTLYLSQEVEQTLISTITELMRSYEEWSGTPTTYDQESMPAPGCQYQAVKQIGDKTEPVID